MVCVPPDHPNQSSKPVVNEEATSVKQRSLAVARLCVFCFRAREEQVASSSVVKMVGDINPTAD
jgi:hypothetical protein